MRGKQKADLNAKRWDRITPACAGKTLRQQTPAHHRKDHPRVCGENCKRRARPWGFRRSPPRVRGKPIISLAGIEIERITPACAGKTICVRMNASCARDHPRVCGENLAGKHKAVQPRGSPPRVRGKQFWQFSHRLQPRITPACAGKTARAFSKRCWKEDHPRVCGEND